MGPIATRPWIAPRRRRGPRALVLVLATLAAVPARAEVTPPPAGPATEAAPGRFTRIFGRLHPAAGVGIAFRWPHVAGKLVPVSVTWKDDRYELFASYFQDEVVTGYRLQDEPAHVAFAPPHRTYALSRRFNLVDRPRLRTFAGVGVAYEDTKLCHTVDEANDRTVTLDYDEPVYHGCDKLNGSHLNYMLQLGIRYYSADRSQGVEFAYRHVSNAGLAAPNLGENFATLVLVF